MATTVRVPDTDGTVNFGTVFPASPTTHFDKVDEGVPGDDDTTYVEAAANATIADFLELEAMPGDFGVATDVFVRFRDSISGVVDDTVNGDAQVYESDEATPIGTAAASATGDHAYATVVGASASDSANKATWDTRMVRIRQVRSNSGMPDAVVFRITSIEVEIDYTAVSGGDGTDMPWPETGQPVRHKIGVVASGPKVGAHRA